MPAPTRTSREKALSKLEKRNLAHIWPHREPHPLCTLSCQAPGPPHPLSLFPRRPNGALESCSFARHSLLQTLHKV